jgi:hypothetical protein
LVEEHTASWKILTLLPDEMPKAREFGGGIPSIADHSVNRTK